MKGEKRKTMIIANESQVSKGVAKMELDREYKFMTIKEFSELICDIYEGYSLVDLDHADKNVPTIDFTFDSEEDTRERGEAEGWYGITAVKLFDANYLAIGYYNGLYLETLEIDEYFVPEEIERKLNNFAYFEGLSSEVSIDANTLPPEIR